MTVISNTPEATTNDQKVCLKWIDYPQTLVCNIKVHSVLDNKQSRLGNATPFVTPLYFYNQTHNRDSLISCLH